MLKTKVKVGSVTNLSEARYCAGMGVDFLSFPLANVDAKTYKEITSWVAGPKFGIELDLGDSSPISDYQPDFIQISSENLDYAPTHPKLIVKLDPKNWVAEKSKLQSAKEKILVIELALLSADSSSESIIREACKEFEVLLKLSNMSDLDRVLQWPISGLSFEGSSEVRVGLKEYPLAEVLEKLEVD